MKQSSHFSNVHNNALLSGGFREIRKPISTATDAKISVVLFKPSAIKAADPLAYAKAIFVMAKNM